MRFEFRPSTIALLVVIVIVLAIGFASVVKRKPGEFQESSIGNSAGSRPSPSTSPGATASPAAKHGALAMRKFSLDAGDLPPGTEIKRDAAGRIASLRGSIPLGSADADTDLDRARRILDEVVLRSGRSDLAFGDPKVNGTSDADQIFFPQVVGAVPLFPPRGLNMLIGSGGTLEALDADFSDPVEMRGAEPPPPPSGSVTVVYVERRDDRTVGRYAYRSEKMG